jgi:hypothetical protein
MKINKIKFPFEHIIIDDMYTEDELKLIWKEIDFLTPKFLSESSTGSAKNKKGSILKKGKGIFLDSFYNNRTESDILKFNRKLFADEIVTSAIEVHPLYRFMLTCDNDSTLLNHYKNNDYYEQHTDGSIISALTFFKKDDNSFDGGDLVFADFNYYTVESKNNKTIIFPGCYPHGVEKIKMKDNETGRFSMVQFLSFKT